MRRFLKKIPGLPRLYFELKLWTNRESRSVRLLQLFSKNLFQPFPDTAFDRYPAFFSFVKERLSGIEVPRVLSFGCSTGEEVFSLHRYMPNAEILGIDINPRSIEICNKRLKFLKGSPIAFKCAGLTDPALEGDFDAVFSCAVFRHGSLKSLRPQYCGDILDFGRFDETVSALCRQLKVGGYLVIWHAHFRFRDTSSYKYFRPVFNWSDEASRDNPVYGPDNRLLSNVQYSEAIFLKIS